MFQFSGYWSKNNGSEPKGKSVKNELSGSAGAPKLPEDRSIDREDQNLPLSLQCDKEQESIYLDLDLNHKDLKKILRKKGSKIELRGDSRVGEIKGILRLNSIYKKSGERTEYRFKQLYKLMWDLDILNLSYERLKSRISVKESSYRKERLLKLSDSLRDFSYRPKPSKSFLVEKVGGGWRTIKAPCFEDKIVQEVFRMILSSIWEPKFSNRSFGFREGIGCHDALRFIKCQFKTVDYWFKSDFASCFDNIDRHKLRLKLEEFIDDRSFIDLYWKLVKVGYLDQFRVLQTSISGVPQGGIISPILINIYLNDFDIIIEEIINKVKLTSVKRKINPDWRSLRYKIKKLKTEGKRISDFLTLRAGVSYFSTKKNKLNYVRYADDFIVGLRGSSEFCQSQIEIIRKKVGLIEGLELSLDKTIFCSSSKPVKFLGILISFGHQGKNSLINRKFVKVNTLGINRRHAIPLNRDIIFHAPIIDIKNKLAYFGYCYSGNKSSAKACLRFYAIDHNYTIMIINSVFRGINNYYSFVDNRPQLIWIVRHLLWTSAALLMKRKYNLQSLGQVVKKYSIGLNKGLRVQPLIIKHSNSFKVNNWDFKRISKHKNLGTLPLAGAVIYKRWTLDNACSLCGSEINVEVHHVRGLKNINRQASFLAQQISKVNRSQISLCRKCHLIVHRDKR